ncbi:DUF4145 domain-containing protein [Vibrio parahaemolyticus]|uniref:DUF4145 domain-containing protein n=1 Tax=Vibrio parahaemolyticus TaxID=670 RepID=UPI0029E1C2B9|nr:DUF4145 domain-containing protein [Vibrio parahaemolyticus]
MERVLFPNNIKRDYLGDVVDPSTKLHYRALAVRSCLELLLKHLFYKFVQKDISKERWDELFVSRKIDQIKKYSSFDASFYEKIDYLKTIGNKGAHAAEHPTITHPDLDLAFEYLSSICTYLIFEYFKENSMQGTENTSTIFSCLQPIQRVDVLCKYINMLENKEYDAGAAKQYYSKYVEAYHNRDIDETVHREHFPKPLRLRHSLNKKLSAEFLESSSLQHYDELLIAIDKLSLAYLKLGSMFLATCTVHRFYANGHLTTSYYDEQCEKLEKLAKKTHKYPIAKTQDDSIKNLEDIEKIFASDLDKSFAKLIKCMLTNEN